MDMYAGKIRERGVNSPQCGRDAAHKPDPEDNSDEMPSPGVGTNNVDVRYFAVSMFQLLQFMLVMQVLHRTVKGC